MSNNRVKKRGRHPADERGRQVERSQRIVFRLSRRGPASEAELADEFEVRERTIYRAMIALRRAGVPVYKRSPDAEESTKKSVWALDLDKYVAKLRGSANGASER